MSRIGAGLWLGAVDRRVLNDLAWLTRLRRLEELDGERDREQQRSGCLTTRFGRPVLAGRRKAEIPGRVPEERGK
jgi:hypothetical protein